MRTLSACWRGRLTPLTPSPPSPECFHPDSNSLTVVRVLPTWRAHVRAVPCRAGPRTDTPVFRMLAPPDRQGVREAELKCELPQSSVSHKCCPLTSQPPKKKTIGCAALLCWQFNTSCNFCPCSQRVLLAAPSTLHTFFPPIL